MFHIGSCQSRPCSPVYANVHINLTPEDRVGNVVFPMELAGMDIAEQSLPESQLILIFDICNGRVENGGNRTKWAAKDSSSFGPAE
ncbi:uncharacterized protein N7482_000376 [Penicillium canariense]|uniref:Uncharacterized protein n=1 Tax=Penicillium canariense TaxID=189055 RepID=A0A9W9LSV9_9EURO|nr:uncharacterized protein N7482_000376 [Penicillium canariense]KAJ5174499.1 hypothetical protein N7482_000376 [Penicillium canariense]